MIEQEKEEVRLEEEVAAKVTEAEPEPVPAQQDPVVVVQDEPEPVQVQTTDIGHAAELNHFALLQINQLARV